MFKVGEIIVHGRDICKVTNVVKNYREGQDYYKLASLGNEGLTIYSPTANARGMARKIASKAAIKDLIKNIPSINPLESEGGALAAEYKALLGSGTHEDLICIIKTAHRRNQSNARDQKKLNENDKVYLRQAEAMLYSEVAATLDVPYDEAKDYIVNQVSTITGSDSQLA